MKKIFATLLLTILMPVTLPAQGYTNPIIPGYHPDPSVCRVGEKFYLVNSTFQYFPGVPVFESTDLAHWTLIGHALTRDSQLPLPNANSWMGIYAPTIRYHEGTYYMVTTNVGTGPNYSSYNFFVTATDPAGPWSEPVRVDQGGIDPSLLFDEGKCYFVSNPDDALTLCEINPQTGEKLTESRVIWEGTGGRYPEAPHIYKKDGWYYLLIAEGGTEMAHSLTIARSRYIYGPYEANPDNPILTHCRRAAQASPIQGTGHGDFVQAQDGSWWLVFLAFRLTGFGTYHHLGRETFLAPVEWPEGGWPVVNGGNPIELDMARTTLPGTPSPDGRYLNTGAGGFTDMGLEWIHIQNPIAGRYEHVGPALRLHASPGSLTQNDQPTFVGRRQESATITTTVTLDAGGLQPGDEAGLSVYQIHLGHLDIAVRRLSDGTLAVVQRSVVMSLEKEIELLRLNDPRVTLRVTSDGNNYTLAVAPGTDAGRSDAFTSAPPLNCALVSTEVVGGFTGVILGMYATGQGHADFLTFDYQEEQ